MKIAIVGGTGNIGTRLTKEAVSRGHTVTTVSRNPEKAHKDAKVTAKKGDVTDPKALGPLLAGHDVVISAVRFSESPAGNVVGATKDSGVKRLLVVGGAASLKDKDGKLVLESLPEAWRGEAGAGLKFLETLRGETGLDWTFLSPSALIGPGERTGKFRLGLEELLVDKDGKSHISYEDYAIAMIDEVEKPKHSRKRFTVGY
ncbi:MAG TPA: NAD(P)-dependent oxidoreductase [Stellaceae bacterium]|nr:NAD(P)-dependent oxidoreductase [Stellaceae bacterium]